MDRGLLRPLPGGDYEVFSLEAVNGSGQRAHAGDYVKLDEKGGPYPNRAVDFEAHHTPASDGEYFQRSVILEAWSPEEPMCGEVEFLIREKGLVLDPAHPERYYTAPLWGTVESVPREGVLVFYRIDRRENGEISDAEFNFVDREVFDRTYSVL